MKILALVTDAFGGTGGIAKYSRDLITAMSTYPAVSRIDVAPRVIARTTESIPEKVAHHGQSARSTLRYLTTVLRFALPPNSPHWILCGHMNLLPAAITAARVAGARLILMTYGLEAWYPKSSRTPRQVRRSTAVASISELTLGRMREWVNLTGIPSFVLPNAVDLSQFAQGQRNDQLAKRLGVSDRKVILTLGRMDAAERAKGFDQIMESLPALAARIPDITYIAAGDGTDRPRLEARARELGIADRVVFPGYIAESEKADYFRLANVFAMPSPLEGFGYVFLEALSSGVPVIASQTDGGREVLRNGLWGLLVNPDKNDEIVDAIESAITNPRFPPRHELEYYSVAQFNKRCHTMLDALTTRVGMPQQS